MQINKQEQEITKNGSEAIVWLSDEAQGKLGIFLKELLQKIPFIPQFTE
jgi:hypothetical protein